MAAAIASSGSGNEVHIYEKNEKLGKKLFITGKGRCNLTNAADMKTAMDNVVSNPKFLYSAFGNFTNEDTIKLIEGQGCKTKVERGGRVFPVSDHSYDVIDALKKELKANGVNVHLNHKVNHLNIEDGICTGFDNVKADRVILATGGLSYQSTGSTGDGVAWAEKLLHGVTTLKPALVPLLLKENVAQMMGLSLKNVTASLYAGEKEIYSEFGEMLFTHFGVSGPIILSASSYVSKRFKGNANVSGVIPVNDIRLEIDLKPALDHDTLDARLLRDFDENKNRALKNSLGKLLPSGIISEVIRQSEISPEKKVNEITRAEREKLVKALKTLTFSVTGTRGWDEAIITQGGVSVKDINPKTMESKKVSNLYFAGEMIDVDALTGGFNLQIAWSTGWTAGKSAGSNKD